MGTSPPTKQHETAGSVTLIESAILIGHDTCSVCLRPGRIMFGEIQVAQQLRFLIGAERCIAGDGHSLERQRRKRFFFGDSQRMKSLGYQFYDKTEATELVARILRPPQGRERLAWPERYRSAPNN